MSEEGRDVLGVMVGAALIICLLVSMLTPSQMMRQCVQLGYEWIEGDCVKGATYD